MKDYQTIPQLLRHVAHNHADVVVQMSRSDGGAFVPRSYAQLQETVMSCAAGLDSLGVTRESHVGIVSENRSEWLVSDLAILSLGAADVPRGNDSTAEELAFILGLPKCRVVIVENAAQREKIAGLIAEDRLPELKNIIVLDGAVEGSAPRGAREHRFSDLLAAGAERLATEEGLRAQLEAGIDAGQPEDLATIIFTSGTTGEPKGVMLTHQNFVYQVRQVPSRIDIDPGDIWLSVLPVWHSFERILQYIAIASATTLAYSRPIGTVMLADMAEIKPRWMASVPRIWEAVRAGIYRNIKTQGGATEAIFNFFVAVGSAHKHLADRFHGRLPDFSPRNRGIDKLLAVGPLLLLTPLKALGNVLVFRKITNRLGGEFIAGVSAGGALPRAVDDFFGAVGVLLLEGYGLTETAPVLAIRHQHRTVPGTVGEMLSGTECSIRDEQGNELPPGEMGLIYVRGPQVMLGYYERPQLTAAVLSEDGWLNTGDLGMMSHRGELKITGRAKDTIVLLGGENIEPLPIEQKLQESDYIERAVVVGQDQKYLGALVCPSMAALRAYADEQHIPYGEPEDLLLEGAIRELIGAEVGALVNRRTGFKGFELIYHTALVPDDFEVGRELSAKQEIKRHVISERYQTTISGLFE